MTTKIPSLGVCLFNTYHPETKEIFTEFLPHLARGKLYIFVLIPSLMDISLDGVQKANCQVGLNQKNDMVKYTFPELGFHFELMDAINPDPQIDVELVCFKEGGTDSFAIYNDSIFKEFYEATKSESGAKDSELDEKELKRRLLNSLGSEGICSFFTPYLIDSQKALGIVFNDKSLLSAEEDVEYCGSIPLILG